ncbi:MAG: hypothetical protein WDM89_13955 [Rhizomicrobium sp.]
MALFALWPTTLTFIVAVILIGSRQLGLAILMHDAAHGVLMRTHWLNEWGKPVVLRLPCRRGYDLLSSLPPEAPSLDAAAGRSRSRFVRSLSDHAFEL